MAYCRYHYASHLSHSRSPLYNTFTSEMKIYTTPPQLVALLQVNAILPLALSIDRPSSLIDTCDCSHLYAQIPRKSHYGYDQWSLSKKLKLNVSWLFPSSWLGLSLPICLFPRWTGLSYTSWFPSTWPVSHKCLRVGWCFADFQDYSLRNLLRVVLWLFAQSTTAQHRIFNLSEVWLWASLRCTHRPPGSHMWCNHDSRIQPNSIQWIPFRSCADS